MKKKFIRISLTSVLLLVAWLTEHNCNLQIWQILIIYLIPYLLISYDVLHEAVEGIMEGDPFDENFLMAVATIGAFVVGFLPNGEPQFLEGVFVMLFFQIGELFEHYAEDKTRDSISNLMDIRPDTANVLRNGESIVVNPSTIAVGEVVIIKPGEKIPLDGEVIEGSSSLNTIALTGESVPKDVAFGDSVISGCVNISGVLKVKVNKTFSNSTASRILNLVEEASESKSKSESFIRRFARIYTPIVVISALFLAFIPPFFATSYTDALFTWLYRALTFLIVSCPCALVISIPLSFFCGIGGAGHVGILIKGGNYMEALARTKTIVFDKTGTLTRGVFEVESIHPNNISEQQLLHLAAHVEQYSNHPIATTLCNAYKDSSCDCKVENIKEIAGQGISAEINGKNVCVGNEKMMKSIGAEIANCNKCNHFKGTIIYVAIDGVYAGHIIISDQIKTDSAHAITTLKEVGIEKTVMLTGDHKEVANFVAEQLGIDEHYSELMPADKVEHVERLLNEKSANKTLAFVGDGINDAPVLARADIGIAMGALGSDAAIEAADVVLMDDKPSKITKAIGISRRTIGIARQNAIFAIGIKVAVLALSTFGIATMGMAVFADVGVMVVAVLNATRALKVK
ncbi:heavy metal translocating P-type ATPase [Prevotella aurantiaca]|jgi:cadmium-exporting ATPase|uniref:P-type Zn(2+) transporter n=1 Tax=Prevotella aurantiaca TaxID=596085 RepID=A0A930N0K5_9BACT|nr:heavy metal translocating P-type ATPase [Prevotella aurantiaca]MBF1383727.1 cadmium-translocating P-type ATPase [Prevotella aurantiaca]